MTSSRTKPSSAGGARVAVAVGVLSATLVSGLVLSSLLTAGGTRPDEDELLASARKTINPEDVEAHLLVLASPELEGRDSPSRGLNRAADYLSSALESYGFRGAAEDDGFRLAFSRALPVPDRGRCKLEFENGDRAERGALDVEFVPLPGCSGEAEGPMVFVGYGIDRKGYDDLNRATLKGSIAVILEGEPRHERLFDGKDVITEAADVYDKVQTLVKEDVAGVLVVRRPPSSATEGPDGPDGVDLDPPVLGYRYTWATWNPATTKQGPRRRQSFSTPVLEITPALAERMLGRDVIELAEKIDRSGKPLRATKPAGNARLVSKFTNERVRIDNVAGILEGSDPALRDEYLVLGAHYDHIGVDSWGRIAFGADDNGSGTAAMLEVAQALSKSPPRRSVVLAFFAAEEDNLLGSASFADAPPVPRESIVAMLNMDMVGRGKENEVVVLGTRQNPDLDEVLDLAKDQKGHGIKRIITNRADHLWMRSDHFSFHRAGIPVLFFFEAVSEELNRDYHTFRDTVDLVNLEKVSNTAKLCLHVTWLLANADIRPGAPRNR